MIGRALVLGEIAVSPDTIVYQVLRGNVVCFHHGRQLERQHSNTLAHILNNVSTVPERDAFVTCSLS